MTDVLDFIKGFGAGSDILSKMENIRALREHLGIAQSQNAIAKAQESRAAAAFPTEQAGAELNNKIKQHQLDNMDQLQKLIGDPAYGQQRQAGLEKDLGRPLAGDEKALLLQSIQSAVVDHSLDPVNQAVTHIFTNEETNKRSKFLQGPDPTDKKIDEGFNAKGQRVRTFQKPTGQTYNVVDPDIVKPPDTNQQNNRSDRSYQYNNAELDKVGKPLEDTVQRLGRLKDTIAQGSPQADALVAPELLTVMAGGAGSGLRMNEAEISRIVGGRSKWESLKAAVNQWSLDPSKANSITPDQRQQIHALITTVDTKLQQKVGILSQARQDLVNEDNPRNHRKIVQDARAKLTGIDSGAGGFFDKFEGATKP